MKTPLGHFDSVQKIIDRYFVAIAKKDFIINGVRYSPKPLHISPQIRQGYSCPSSCRACCKNYSMDYLPTENEPHMDLAPHSFRKYVSNGKRLKIKTYFAESFYYCQFLNKENGRCLIHLERAFSCKIEPLRFREYKDHIWCGVMPYGRGWNMKKINGERGAICTFDGMKTTRDEGIREAIVQLGDWAEAFNIPHKVQEILEYFDSDNMEKIVI